MVRWSMSNIFLSFNITNSFHINFIQLNIDEHIYLYMVEETNKDNSAFVEIKDGSISKIDSEIFDTKVFPMFLEKFREY